MKYEAIFFDYGNTLGKLEDLSIPKPLQNLPKLLYNRGYRLAVISNSSRYSDGLWLRKRLDSYGLLPYFEVVLCSSVIGVKKPNPDIFQRVVNLMGVNPKRTLFVGDTPAADGGCSKLGMDYLHVNLTKQIWTKKLMEKLSDATHEKRKLSHITEYIWQDEFLCPQIRHFSMPVSKGDHLLINGIEYKITEELPKTLTKDLILSQKDGTRMPLKLKQID